MNDTEIRAVVERLSRPHSSGGQVIECAALPASGGDYEAIMAWIVAHGGAAEAPSPKSTKGGLHGSRLQFAGNGDAPAPTRFVLPAAAFA